MSESLASSDLARAMGPVAIAVRGEPDQTERGGRVLRWGNNGGLSVDLDNGVWCDHTENDDGGGTLAFVMREKKLEKPDALKWLHSGGYINKPEPQKKLAKAGLGPIVAAYDYFSADGDLRFQVTRHDPKTFRQRRPDGNGGWINDMTGVERVIYRLPGVLDAVAAGRTIWIAEGEKSVHALESIGLVGTCSPMGAGKWQPEYNLALAGADVVILPDNDIAGEKHAADVANHLRGVAARVRTLMIPELPPKGDVADWIAAGGTREPLEALLEALGAEPAQPKPQAPATSAANPDEDAQEQDIEAMEAVVAVVADFNDRYMMVSEAGKAVIFQPGYDPVLKRRHYDRLGIRDLTALYMNHIVKVGCDEKGRPVYKTAADVWLRSPERRQFIHGVVFDPTNKQTRPGVLNLWEGFAVKPARGDWSLMRNHIEEIICGGDPIRFNYLMGWLARMFQRPAEQGEVAVVMQGGEGTGKGTLAKALMHIAGHHGLAISACAAERNRKAA